MTRKRSIDTGFLLLVSGIVLFGLLIFTSAALGLLARDGANFTSVAVNQLLLGLVAGSIGLVFFAKMDYRRLKPLALWGFVGALILTALTLVPGIGLEFKGAARWLSLGPISFQPVEFLKFASVVFLAALYANHFKHVASWKGGFGPLIAVVVPASVVLLLQPDTHGTVMIAFAATAMFFAAGGRLAHFLIIGLLGAGLLGGLILERPYLAQRFETFLNHSADPLGAGYQIQQSLIAVGSGQLWGRGFGQSIQKFSYLPEPMGDSIFAVAAEEFGFAGSMVLVMLFTAFAVFGLRIAARAPDPFGGLMVVGLVVLIVGQSFINMGAAVGIVPLSGLPLIFVSHGGTALAVALAEVGVILSVSRNMRPREE